MTQGLQVWDANGVIVLDTTIRVGTHLGEVSTGRSNGSFYDERLKRGNPYFFASINYAPASWEFINPDVVISGGTISWSFRFNDRYEFGYFVSGRVSLLIRYGVY